MYSCGKIYKLVSSHTDKIYIGSTTILLSKRLSCHRSAHYGTTEKLKTAAGELFDLGDVTIELIEDYPCNTRLELVMREQYWIDYYRDWAVNKYNPYTTHEQIKQRNREKTKQCIERKKQDPEWVAKRNQYTKNYYAANKEQYEANRKQLINCECGSIITKGSLNKHKRTATHLQKMNVQIP